MKLVTELLLLNFILGRLHFSPFYLSQHNFHTDFWSTSTLMRFTDKNFADISGLLTGVTYTTHFINIRCTVIHHHPLFVVVYLAQQPPQWAMASSFTRFLDHTQRRTTVGRTPLDEWSARRRDLYLTTQNTHSRKISMLQVGFEPKIPAGERPQTYALDSAATGTGSSSFISSVIRPFILFWFEGQKWHLNHFLELPIIRLSLSFLVQTLHEFVFRVITITIQTTYFILQPLQVGYILHHS